MNINKVFGVSDPVPVVESKLFNSGRPTVTLLVESGFDERFWRMHTAENTLVRQQGQGGRAKAIRELDKAKLHDNAKLLGILDADFDRVEGRLVIRPDVIWTDANDLEATLVALPVLEKILRQKAGPERLQCAEETWGESFRERLLRHAIGMGRLRWLKQRGETEIVFAKPRKNGLKRITYSKCVGDGWEPDLGTMIKQVLNFNNVRHLSLSDLKKAVGELPTVPELHVCNGHDLIGFIHVWIKSVVSIWKGSAESLADSLAAACDQSWLATTQMWKAIRAWESEHPGYCILQIDPNTADDSLLSEEALDTNASDDTEKEGH